MLGVGMKVEAYCRAAPEWSTVPIMTALIPTQAWQRLRSTWFLRPRLMDRLAHLCASLCPAHKSWKWSITICALNYTVPLQQYATHSSGNRALHIRSGGGARPARLVRRSKPMRGGPFTDPMPVRAPRRILLRTVLTTSPIFQQKARKVPPVMPRCSLPKRTNREGNTCYLLGGL